MATRKKSTAEGGWTEQEIVKLLSIRHSEDVFVSQCKAGPTTTGCVRLDAWAMPRSWANPSTYGYEVKVSRSDWGRDTKWQSYLPLCNQLYIVCPRGLIAKDEVPHPLGLVYAIRGEKVTRLATIKRAAVRDVPVPENLCRYVLMWRATIQRENSRPESREHAAEVWKAWLESRIDLQRVGRLASKSVAKLLEERLLEKRIRGGSEQPDDECRRKLRELERVLMAAGIWMNHYDTAELERVTAALQAFRENRDSTRLASDIRQACRGLEAVAVKLEAMPQKGAE